MDTFLGLAEHPWLNKVWKKLSADELRLATHIIERYENLNRDEFEKEINRFFLGMPQKPKHYQEIMELLSCANSTAEDIPK